MSDQTFEDRLRLALYSGLQKGERAIELAERIMAMPEMAALRSADDDDEEDWRSEAIHLGI